MPLAQIQRLSLALEEERAVRRADASSSKWSWLAKVQKYQRALQELTLEYEKSKEGWSRERAELQVGGSGRPGREVGGTREEKAVG